MRTLRTLILALLLVMPMMALAQEGGVDVQGEQAVGLLAPEPKITVRSSVQAGERLFIDGSSSVNYYPENSLEYVWDLGNGAKSDAKKFQFIYDEPGRYTITLSLHQRVLDETSGQEVDLDRSVSAEVYVYNAMGVLLTDNTANQEHLASLLGQADQEKFYFMQITSSNKAGLLEQEALVKQIQDNASEVQEAEMVVLWGDAVSALNLLDYFGQQYAGSVDFKTKTIVLVGDGGLTTAKRIAESTFLLLRPKQILFVREPAVNKVIEAEGKADKFTQLLHAEGYEYEALNEETHTVSLWNLFPYLIGRMVANGVSNQVILYLLILPVIATLVAFFRQVVGLATAGVYVPALLTLTFVFLGLKMGLLVFATVLVAGLLVRRVLGKKRLLYTPKMALSFSFVALALFVMIGVVSAFYPGRVLTLSIFPVLVLATLSEKITGLESGKSIREMLYLFFEITVVSVVAYFVVGEWRWFQTLMRAYPEVVFLFVVANYFLGRWSGLRLFEYFRFRVLIKEMIKKEEEEEE